MNSDKKTKEIVVKLYAPEKNDETPKAHSSPAVFIETLEAPRNLTPMICL